MTKRELVQKAISFNSPERIPIFFFNRDQPQGDVLYYPLCLMDGNKSEWGYVWKQLGDDTMGQPEMPVFPTWTTLATYKFPVLNADERLQNLGQIHNSNRGHYLLAGMGITGFNNYTFLRGFENALIDFASGDERAYALLDGVADFENELIRLAAQSGFNGVHFQDDWGTQSNMIISPQMWRTVFKPRYRRQFDFAKRLGLDVWFHSCGNITDIAVDFHEIGVSVLNLSQPNVVDITRTGALLRGKQCFMVPISYQTISLCGTLVDIYEEAERLYNHLAGETGGFIGYVEDYSCLGMSEANYQACIRSFTRLCRSKSN